MTDAEYNMLLAIEAAKGKYMPDWSVQQISDTVRVLNSKKYITWNVLGDGVVILSKGRAALSEERLRRNEQANASAATVSQSSNPEPPPSPAQKFLGQVAQAGAAALVEKVIDLFK